MLSHRDPFDPRPEPAPTPASEPVETLLRWWLGIPSGRRRTLIYLGGVGSAAGLGAAALTPPALIPLGVLVLGLVSAGGAGYLVGGALSHPPQDIGDTEDVSGSQGAQVGEGQR
ncbi:hypothetical protein [Nocardiopsis sp. NPDC006938]|uniref:hypothetical protein n=1 Tax=Nocardiopsis sp. NPDC006938 TaxID=3364337 RepID=UPI003694CF1D